jgi:hypothetical protein
MREPQAIISLRTKRVVHCSLWLAQLRATLALLLVDARVGSVLAALKRMLRRVFLVRVGIVVGVIGV